ncbi:MAG: PLDc N-terminal domain-containing protein [Defluviitaleaceae bacterium]|nr:PLDc N-terminal domain-containing protein [Defluviitaleaceae bacterium]
MININIPTLLFVIFQFVLFLAAIIDVVKKPSTIGSERIVWVVVICVVNIIGPILYLAVGSRRLDKFAANDWDYQGKIAMNKWDEIALDKQEEHNGQ